MSHLSRRQFLTRTSLLAAAASLPTTSSLATIPGTKPLPAPEPALEPEKSEFLSWAERLEKLGLKLHSSVPHATGDYALDYQYRPGEDLVFVHWECLCTDRLRVQEGEEFAPDKFEAMFEKLSSNLVYWVEAHNSARESVPSIPPYRYATIPTVSQQYVLEHVVDRKTGLRVDGPFEVVGWDFVMWTHVSDGVPVEPSTPAELLVRAEHMARQFLRFDDLDRNFALRQLQENNTTLYHLVKWQMGRLRQA